jgi:hypothetical protein
MAGQYSWRRVKATPAARTQAIVAIVSRDGQRRLTWLSGLVLDLLRACRRVLHRRGTDESP